MKFIIKFKRFLILMLLLILYISVCAVSYTNAVCTNIADSVFRLHVVANSDSDEDQNLKYIVRDSVINYINKISKDSTSKSEVIQNAKNNLEEIKSIAEQTIWRYNFTSWVL